jgi:integrase
VYAAAGLDAPDMPFHCLRHTFGTELAKRVPLPVVRELMGHREISTTMRYVTVDDSQHHDAIALVFGRQAGDKSARRA